MFDNVIGHAENKKILESQVKEKAYLHSYLFEGVSGIGKKKMAFEFAKKILDVDNLKASADFKYISRLDGKKDIVIEQIRDEITQDVYIVPSKGDRKVYIIDDAQYLNVAAQNALLKTLEEPPSYVIIILIASSINEFLPTIISRLSVMHFNRLSNDELATYLRQTGKPAITEKYLDYLNGSVGKAEKLFENAAIDNLNNVDGLVESIKNKNNLEAIKKAQSINFNATDIIDYLEYTLYKNNLYSSIAIVEKAIQRLKYNGNYDIVIDNMILKIIDNI